MDLFNRIIEWKQVLLVLFIQDMYVIWNLNINSTWVIFMEDHIPIRQDRSVLLDRILNGLIGCGLPWK